MADDYEDLYDLDSLDDDEVHDLVLEELREYLELDPDRIDALVEGGFVTLAGRVGTERELQEVESIVSDLLGIGNYSNELVVDELARGERSEAADDAAAEQAEAAELEGEVTERTEPSADFLRVDLDGELYGTQDMHQAIERGETYEPPDRPIPGGYWSEENH